MEKQNPKDISIQNGKKKEKGFKTVKHGQLILPESPNSSDVEVIKGWKNDRNMTVIGI